MTTLCSHQWIFITDTVDAIYHPDDWFPEAMMDQLAEIVGNLPIAETRVSLWVNYTLHILTPGVGFPILQQCSTSTSDDAITVCRATPDATTNAQ
jgi:hypothetical protein